ncbi:MAG: hypothetical protein FD156_1205 [Nitrospirae bacterium]|nr:MAG: hypothetical protein FD156_1205 [Nitrospirota bacterium]
MIATTIKKQYLDDIEARKKPVDYRACNEFWKKKIEGKRHGAILFLCGQRCRAFKIKKITVVPTPEELRHVISTPTSYAIHLGGAYHWPRQIEMFKKMGVIEFAEKFFPEFRLNLYQKKLLKAIEKEEVRHGARGYGKTTCWKIYGSYLKSRKTRAFLDHGAMEL